MVGLGLVSSVEQMCPEHGAHQWFSALRGGDFGGLSLAAILGVLQLALSGSSGELKAVSLPLTVFPANKLSTNGSCC